MPLSLHLLVATLPLLIWIAAFYYSLEETINSRILTSLLIPDEVGRINYRIVVVLLSLY